jgi:hypothetical protein
VFGDFFKVICQVGVFMVCTQVILHFRPNKDYEKYMRMLVGAMVLLQIFIPVVRLFSSSGVSDLEGSISGFAREIDESRKAAEASGIAADRILEKMTLEQVREALAQQGIGGQEEGQQGEGQQEEGQQRTGQQGTGQQGTGQQGTGQQGTGQQGTGQQGVRGESVSEQSLGLKGTMDEDVSAGGDSIMQAGNMSGEVTGDMMGEIDIEEINEIQISVGDE